MTFEQFKKSICDKDPQVKWALDLIDEEVKEALQHQREEMANELIEKLQSAEEWMRDSESTDPMGIPTETAKEIINQVLKEK